MSKFLTFDIPSAYDALHRSFPSHKTTPIIGLTGNFRDGDCTLAEGYYQSVLKAGGTPFILPPFEETDALIQALESIDGLLLTGGADINPLYLNEEPIKELHGINPRRDYQELMLTKLAADRQIPILGICRGIQTLMAALGGTLYQDIHSQMEGTRIKHDQDLDRSYASHTVTIEKDTLLHRLFQTDTLAVNSFHHQAVKEVAPGFQVCAYSSDGVIEAVE
jgi:gamma-glutamyl-gamma-aminobutyrate hydrolase PuuD